MPPRTLGEVDVVFPLLHGPYGEDGTIQGLLELAGVPLRRLRGARLRGGDGQGLHEGRCSPAPGCRSGRTPWSPPGRGGATGRGRDGRRARARLPVFVKPARAGSSIGITKVTEPDDLDAAIEAAREHDPQGASSRRRSRARDRVRRARGVDGRRRPRPACPARSGRRRARVLRLRGQVPRDEARPARASRPTCPTTSPRCSELAVRPSRRWAARAWPGSTSSSPTTATCVVNEINTMPGFTPISMFPRMWAATGLDYPTLVDRLIAAGAGAAHRPALTPRQPAGAGRCPARASATGAERRQQQRLGARSLRHQHLDRRVAADGGEDVPSLSGLRDPVRRRRPRALGRRSGPGGARPRSAAIDRRVAPGRDRRRTSGSVSRAACRRAPAAGPRQHRRAGRPARSPAAGTATSTARDGAAGQRDGGRAERGRRRAAVRRRLRGGRPGRSACG